MNFLAHALLAGDEPALIVGGVVGDWIKGPLPGALPDDLAEGVALHRAIDSFAETHPAFQQSRARISAPRRRYAGVFVDIFYDHLLAQHWATLDHRPLADYCATVYALIEKRLPDLPAPAHAALRLMASEDWLSSYARIDGIADVLARMSRRARQPNPLAQGEQEFLADVAGFSGDFHAWLGDTRAFCPRWLAEREDQRMRR
jgi:acyl carrier protein phosphodiesterase